MFTIAKRFSFDASHQLTGLPEGHKCTRLHGHTYTVELELAAPNVNDVGMVLDYGEMAPFKTWLDETFDHRHLNDVVAFNPTAERLARHLFRVATEMLGGVVSAVRVSETPNTMAEYRP